MCLTGNVVNIQSGKWVGFMSGLGVKMCLTGNVVNIQSGKWVGFMSGFVCDR